MLLILHSTKLEFKIADKIIAAPCSGKYCTFTLCSRNTQIVLRTTCTCQWIITTWCWDAFRFLCIRLHRQTCIRSKRSGAFYSCPRTAHLHLNDMLRTNHSSICFYTICAVCKHHSPISRCLLICETLPNMECMSEICSWAAYNKINETIFINVLISFIHAFS